jgi:hypothetical protein
MNPSKKNRFHEPDLSFFERAYTDSIVPRVMGASAKQRKNHFRQDKFKSDLLKYYGAVKGIGSGKAAWCHLTGWWDSKFVKAAHLVPKSLSGDELSYLFGVGEVILSGRACRSSSGRTYKRIMCFQTHPASEDGYFMREGCYRQES